MEDNIAGYKKDNKDYSKYRANFNSVKNNTNAGNSGAYFNNGYIKDVEEYIFSPSVYSDDFVGPLPDNGIRESENNERIYQKFTEYLTKDNLGLTTLERTVSPEFRDFLNTMPVDNDGYFKVYNGEMVTIINIKEIKKYCENYNATFNELGKNMSSYIKVEKRPINELRPKPVASDNIGVTLIDNEIYSYQLLLEEANENLNLLESYGRMHQDNGIINMDVYSPDVGMIMVYDQMLSEPGKWPQLYIDQQRAKLDSIITNNTGGIYTSFDLWRSDLQANKNSIKYINKTIEDLEKQKRITICNSYAYTDEFENFVIPSNVKEMSSEDLITDSIVGEDKTFVDLTLINNQKDYIEKTFGDGILKEFSVDLNIDYAKLYYYVKEKDGLAAAEQLLDDISDDLNCLNGLARASDFCRNIKVNNILSDLEVHFKGLSGGTINSFEGVAAWLSENPEKTVNYYETMWITQFLATGKYGTLQGLNYEVGQSVGNMLPTVLLNAALNYVNPVLGTVISSTYLAASSGGNKYRQLRWQGYSVEQARLVGAVSGCSEVLTERLLGGLPFLSEVKVTNLKSFLTAMVREGNQEVLQDVINSILLGEEYSLDDAIHTWLIAALTAGEMQGVPLLASAGINEVINRSQITFDGLKMLIHKDDEIIEIDTEFVKKLLQSHPTATREEIFQALADSIKNTNLEGLSNAEHNNIEVNYNLNYSDYINLCNELSIVPESNEIFEKNSVNLYKNIILQCSNSQLTHIISNCNNDVFSLLIANVDYNLYHNQIKNRLNGMDADSVTAIFSKLNKMNTEVCNNLMFDIDSPYMQNFTSKLLEKTLDYYQRAAEFAGTETAKFFETYRSHCERHVKEVALMAMDSASTIMDVLGENGIYSGKVSLMDVYAAGIWHDVGMAAGDLNINGINSNIDVFNKTCNPVKLVETKGGNITRKNHTLNSALAILANADYLSKTFGSDPVKMALMVFAHSKSNSGIGNLTDINDWQFGIEVLDKCWSQYNIEYNAGGNYQSFVDMCKKSGIVNENGEIYSDIIPELATSSLALRVGDANTTTVLESETINQAGKKITYEVNIENMRQLNGADFADAFTRSKSQKNIDPKTIYDLTYDQIILEQLGLKHGVDYKIVEDKMTPSGKMEYKIDILTDLNEHGISVFVDGKPIKLSTKTIGYVRGENSVGFRLLSVSPDGNKDGMLHELCEIKDTNAMAEILFNVNERLGEIRSGQSDNYAASMDFVFPYGTSEETISRYYEAVNALYFSSSTENIRFNFYVEQNDASRISLSEGESMRPTETYHYQGEYDPTSVSIKKVDMSKIVGEE